MPQKNAVEICLDYSEKQALIEAYADFSKNKKYDSLSVYACENFEEAWKSFNSMFKRIEAAGGIVRSPKDEILFIKRLGKWDLPKGKLNKKESAQSGAIREVSEETGLVDLNILKQLESTYHIYTNRKGREVLKETYWFEMNCTTNQVLIPQTEEEITEVKWFPVEKLDIPLQNTYASLKNLLKRYLG